MIPVPKVADARNYLYERLMRRMFVGLGVGNEVTRESLVFNSYEDCSNRIWELHEDLQTTT